MRRLHLSLLGRPQCGLCEDLELALLAAGGDRLQLDLINIDQDAALLEHYRLRIPVLLDSAGRVLLEGAVSEADIAALWQDVSA